MDGTGKVVRTSHTGDVYHCFFYVRAEKKWLRKSLHTRKLSEVLEAGRKLMMMTGSPPTEGMDLEQAAKVLELKSTTN